MILMHQHYLEVSRHFVKQRLDLVQKSLSISFCHQKYAWKGLILRHFSKLYIRKHLRQSVHK